LIAIFPSFLQKNDTFLGLFRIISAFKQVLEVLKSVLLRPYGLRNGVSDPLAPIAVLLFLTKVLIVLGSHLFAHCSKEASLKENLVNNHKSQSLNIMVVQMTFAC